MTTPQTRWLDDITAENKRFRERIDLKKLPTDRASGHAVITCMDPRVNLEAIGIPGFDRTGGGTSTVRIIRTLGGVADDRSLLVGVFLAGIREMTVVMHTDCGSCLAYANIDVIVDNLRQRLPADRFAAFQSEIGEPFRDRLRQYLKVFQTPEEALERELERIRHLPFIPEDLILHGAIYELTSGAIQVLANGYE